MSASERAKPWMKFYPSDWRADPKLRMCSYAARGLWIDMLALMHEAEPYGHLLIGDLPPDAGDLAGLLGGSAEEVTTLLAQLERRQVFSRTDEGVIFSRRMVRDLEQAEVDKANGKRGGNPKLKPKHRPPVNPPDNGGVNPPHKAQRLEVPLNNQPRVLNQSPNKQPESSLPRAEAAAEQGNRKNGVVQIMPRRSDPPERWFHLADKREVDDRDMVCKPVVAGSYLNFVADQVCEAAGINDPQWRGDWRPVIEWLKAGADPETQILPTIRNRARRSGYEPPRSLAYFSQEILELARGSAA